MAARKYDKTDFNARLKTIKNPRNNSYYDPDLGMHVPKRVSQERIRRNTEGEGILGAMLVSMIIGALGLMIAQIIRIRYFALSDASNTVLFLELFVAFWAVILLTALMNKRKLSERVAQIAGVAVMMVAGHNLIWRWPDQMAIIYTPAHVEQVMATLPQHSIVYRGSIFEL